MHSCQRSRTSVIVIFDLKQVDFLHIIYVWLCGAERFGFYVVYNNLQYFPTFFDRPQEFHSDPLQYVKKTRPEIHAKHS